MWRKCSRGEKSGKIDGDRRHMLENFPSSVPPFWAPFRVGGLFVSWRKFYYFPDTFGFRKLPSTSYSSYSEYYFHYYYHLFIVMYFHYLLFCFHKYIFIFMYILIHRIDRYRVYIRYFVLLLRQVHVLSLSWFKMGMNVSNTPCYDGEEFSHLCQ